MDITEALYKEHYHSALLYTYSLCRDYHLSEDIVSESFYKALTSYNDTEERFKLWLFRVCKNAFIDHTRKKGRYTEQDESLSGGVDAADVVLAQEKYRALYHAVELLSEEYREAITLFYFNGMSVSEISVIMRKTASSVKVILHRARKKLKTILEADYGI